MHKTLRQTLQIMIWTLVLLAGSAAGTLAQHPRSAETTGALKKRAYLPISGAPATPTPTPWYWLTYVNSFRAMSGLPRLVEDASWSNGNQLHARYMVKNNVVQHSEDPNNTWYTPEGAAAAQSSNLVANSQVDLTDAWAIDAWMVAPFHSASLLDPQLARAGFGSYRQADGGIQMAAGIDVLRGLGDLPSGVTFPILWPGPGAVVPLRMYWEETPNPLTSCPGYQAPTGLPIVVQVGAGSQTPNVTGHAFTRDSTPLEHCVFSETTYVNPDGGLQNLGRSILNKRDAVIIIPRAPLEPKTTYTVSLAVDGRTHTWSFAVGNIP